MPISGDYKDTLMSRKTLTKFFNYFSHIICVCVCIALVLFGPFPQIINGKSVKLAV